MNSKYPFKWRHLLPEVIILCVRWHLRYPLDYRGLEEMMLDRGLDFDHTTIYRWIQSYSKEFDKRVIAKEEGFMFGRSLYSSL